MYMFESRTDEPLAPSIKKIRLALSSDTAVVDLDRKLGSGKGVVSLIQAGLALEEQQYVF